MFQSINVCLPGEGQTRANDVQTATMLGEAILCRPGTCQIKGYQEGIFEGEITNKAADGYRFSPGQFSNKLWEGPGLDKDLCQNVLLSSPQFFYPIMFLSFQSKVTICFIALKDSPCQTGSRFPHSFHLTS